MKPILILNGPNLNLLGSREPEIYGQQTFIDFFEELKELFPDIVLEYKQSNHEGQLLDWLHTTEGQYAGVIFNAGAYTHTSVALADGIAGITTPVIEVHISNVHKRESFRHRSFLSPVCRGTISGFGLTGYQLAIIALIGS